MLLSDPLHDLFVFHRAFVNSKSFILVYRNIVFIRNQLFTSGNGLVRSVCVVVECGLVDNVLKIPAHVDSNFIHEDLRILGFG